jgi:hypothetical protein
VKCIYIYTDLDEEERNIVRSIKNFSKEPWQPFDEMEFFFLSKLYDEWKRTHPRTYGFLSYIPPVERDSRLWEEMPGGAVCAYLGGFPR